MARRIVYHGGRRFERNRFVFRRALQGHSHPSLDFIYLVRSRLRRRQLEIRYLANHPSSFEIPVLTLGELVNRLLEGSEHRPRLSEMASLFLLEEIIASGESPFPSNPIVGSRHLSTIFQGISNLKQQDVLEPELITRCGVEDSGGPLTKELAWCFARYQARLDDLGMEDWPGLLAMAYRGLLTGTLEFEKQFCDVRSLFVEGLSDLLPLEHALFRLLRDKVQEFVVSSDLLPLANDQNEGSSFAEMRQFLTDPSVKWCSFESTSAKASPRVVCLSTLENEVSWIVESAARLQCEGLTVALVSSRLDSYGKHLTTALSQREIQVADPRGTHPGSRMMLDLVKSYLALIVEGFPRERLFDLLHHPRFDPGLTAEDLHHLEKWARTCDVQKGFKNWAINFPRTIQLMGTGSQETAPEEQPDMLPLLESFSGLMCRLNLDIEEGSAFEWLNVLDRRLGPFLRLAPWANFGTQKASNQILEKMVREFHQLQDYHQTPLKLHQFARLIASLSHSVTEEVDLGPPAVLLTTPGEIAHLEVDVLIWMGLSENEFTTVSAPPANVLMGGGASEIWENRLKNRKNHFFWISGQASKSVIYTCPERTSGTPTLLSPLLRGLAIEKRDWKEHSSVFGADARQNVQRGRRVVQMREGVEASAFDGIVSSATQLVSSHRKSGRQVVSITPSVLEEYMRCGFRFLAERHLGLQQESPGLELTGTTLGGLLHRVLHRFMDRLELSSLRNLNNWTGQARQRLLDILEEELRFLPYRELLRQDLTWSTQEELLRSGLHPDEPGRGVLRDFLTHQAKWLRGNRVEDLEKKLDPVSLGWLETESGDQVEVVLNGTVDRVDRNPDGLVVIDYKTGTVPLRRLYQGWGFQLPLYYLLVRNHYGEKVENAFYFQVQPPLEARLRTVTFPEPKHNGWAVMARHYREKALEVVQALLSGKFPVTLVGATQAGCQECGFRDICRRDVGKTASLRNSGQFPVARPVMNHGNWTIPEAHQQGASGA